MRVREWFDQGAVDPPIGSRNGFRAGPVNHAQRRQDASFLPQALQGLTGQQQAFVGLLGQFGSSRTRARKSDRPNGASCR